MHDTGYLVEDQRTMSSMSLTALYSVESARRPSSPRLGSSSFNQNTAAIPPSPLRNQSPVPRTRHRHSQSSSSLPSTPNYPPSKQRPLLVRLLSPPTLASPLPLNNMSPRHYSNPPSPTSPRSSSRSERLLRDTLRRDEMERQFTLPSSPPPPRQPTHKRRHSHVPTSPSPSVNHLQNLLMKDTEEDPNRDSNTYSQTRGGNLFRNVPGHSSTPNSPAHNHHRHQSDAHVDSNNINMYNHPPFKPTLSSSSLSTSTSPSILHSRSPTRRHTSSTQSNSPVYGGDMEYQPNQVALPSPSPSFPKPTRSASPSTFYSQRRREGSPSPSSSHANSRHRKRASLPAGTGSGLVLSNGNEEGLPIPMTPHEMALRARLERALGGASQSVHDGRREKVVEMERERARRTSNEVRDEEGGWPWRERDVISTPPTTSPSLSRSRSISTSPSSASLKGQRSPNPNPNSKPQQFPKPSTPTPTPNPNANANANANPNPNPSTPTPNQTPTRSRIPVRTPAHAPKTPPAPLPLHLPHTPLNGNGGGNRNGNKSTTSTPRNPSTPTHTPLHARTGTHTPPAKSPLPRGTPTPASARPATPRLSRLSLPGAGAAPVTPTRNGNGQGNGHSPLVKESSSVAGVVEGLGLGNGIREQGDKPLLTPPPTPPAKDRRGAGIGIGLGKPSGSTNTSTRSRSRGSASVSASFSEEGDSQESSFSREEDEEGEERYVGNDGGVAPGSVCAHNNGTGNGNGYAYTYKSLSPTRSTFNARKASERLRRTEGYVSFASIEGCEVPETPVDSGAEGPPEEERGRGRGRGASWMGLKGLGWVFGKDGSGVRGEVVG